MKRVAAIALVLGLEACGDNSQLCGPGTVDVDGVCAPAAPCGVGTVDDGSGQCVPDGTVVCAAGTMFDAVTDRCVLDPNACQGGTVAVGDACVDPATQMVADIEEAAEPNGRGVLGEASASPAGVIVPDAVGGAPFVIHGRISPFQDADGDGQIDADIDTYELAVTGPMMLRITAIGLAGLDGGFVAVAEATGPMSRWRRLSVDPSGPLPHASRRDVYLPAAGTYGFAIADARTLLLPGWSASGDYYVTVDQLDVPAHLPITLAAGSATVTGMYAGSAAPYQVTLPAGTATVKLAIPAAQVEASEVIARGPTVVALADEASGAAQASFTVTAATSTTIVVDDVLDYAGTPTPFTLTVRVVP